MYCVTDCAGTRLGASLMVGGIFVRIATYEIYVTVSLRRPVWLYLWRHTPQAHSTVNPNARRACARERCSPRVVPPPDRLGPDHTG